MEPEFFIAEIEHVTQRTSYELYSVRLLVGLAWPDTNVFVKAIAKADPQYFFGGGFIDPVGSLTRRLMCYTD